MRVRGTTQALVIGLATVVVALGGPHAAASVPPPGQPPARTSGPQGLGFLDAVSAVGARDVWAVGVGSSSESQTLVQHFDGDGWHRVSAPSPGDYAELSSVDALGSQQVWAAGYATVQGHDQSLVEHWDGSGWRRVTSPNPGGRDTALLGVDARSTSDIWAVGFAARPDQSTGTVIEHGNGRAWRVVPDADPGGAQQSALEAVAASSVDDVWAVGYSYGGYPSRAAALVEHWDGDSWRDVATPRRPGSTVLNSVTVVSPSDVWAAGRVDSDHDARTTTLTEHWDGQHWTVVSSPSPPGGGGSGLNGVTGPSSADQWAVGSAGTGTLAEHWDGTRWARVATKDVGSFGSGLTDADARSPSDVWAVGFWAVSPAAERPLVEHWDGNRWTLAER